MKKVFAVTFSDDEPPSFQVADEAGDALGEALLRARELELPIKSQPHVEFDQEYPDFDDFRQHYTLVKNPFDSSATLGGCAFAWVDEEWDAVREACPEHLWKLIESEELWWISPGLHYADRLGYLITNEPHRKDEGQYL